MVTMSPFCRLWVVVPAAPIFVITVETTLSTSPSTCSCWEVKLYNPDPIPEVPLPKKNKPSLVFAAPALVVTNPI